MNPNVLPSRNIVTATEMQAIEARLFEAGMPVAALMEKVGQKLTSKIEQLFPQANFRTASILLGPGHNGGDALVVARELWERGYIIKLYQPLPRAKPLTQAHLNFAKHIGLSQTTTLEAWLETDFIIDGLFGFGLERNIDGELALILTNINQSPIPVVSIDIPSGLHTDSGEVLGTAIAATHTLCLGLWKRAFFQEQALDYLGTSHLIPFGIPAIDQEAILGKSTPVQILTKPDLNKLLKRSPATHKYQMGATLLICGSTTYPGASILAAQAARATGVGMLYVAVPASIQNLVISQVPDAIVIACPETSEGAIAGLPGNVEFSKLTSVAIGPGLTQHAVNVVHQSLSWPLPLIIDADGLNILARTDWHSALKQRQDPTILTPHWGELKRLFPNAMTSTAAEIGDRITLLLKTPLPPQTILVAKGAKTLIKGHQFVINPESTPALARGGSGDILTGIIAGLLAQNKDDPDGMTATAVWWHAQAAQMAEHSHTIAGVSPSVLIQNLIPILRTSSYA